MKHFANRIFAKQHNLFIESYEMFRKIPRNLLSRDRSKYKTINPASLYRERRGCNYRRGK